jgi:hypothetical protein
MICNSGILSAAVHLHCQNPSHSPSRVLWLSPLTASHNSKFAASPPQPHDPDVVQNNSRFSSESNRTQTSRNRRESLDRPKPSQCFDTGTHSEVYIFQIIITHVTAKNCSLVGTALIAERADTLLLEVLTIRSHHGASVQALSENGMF